MVSTGSNCQADQPDGAGCTGCSGTSTFANTGFKVETGTVALDDGSVFTAYRVHPHTTAASHPPQHSVSRQLVYINHTANDTAYGVFTRSGAQVCRVGTGSDFPGKATGEFPTRLASGNTLTHLPDGLRNTGVNVARVTTWYESPVIIFAAPSTYSLPVPTTKNLTGDVTECGSGIPTDDRTHDGRLAIVVASHTDNNCYGGAYLNKNYRVDMGTVAVNGTQYAAVSECMHPHMAPTRAMKTIL